MQTGPFGLGSTVVLLRWGALGALVLHRLVMPLENALTWSPLPLYQRWLRLIAWSELEEGRPARADALAAGLHRGADQPYT